MLSITPLSCPIRFSSALVASEWIFFLHATTAKRRGFAISAKSTSRTIFEAPRTLFMFLIILFMVTLDNWKQCKPRSHCYCVQHQNQVRPHQELSKQQWLQHTATLATPFKLEDKHYMYRNDKYDQISAQVAWRQKMPKHGSWKAVTQIFALAPTPRGRQQRKLSAGSTNFGKQSIADFLSIEDEVRQIDWSSDSTSNLQILSQSGIWYPGIPVTPSIVFSLK